LDLFALVLAGGRGARFWPLSRRALPKQCLSLTGGRTLLQQTVDRLQPLIPRERVLVITGPDMAAAVRAQLSDLPPENILVEPSGRNTAPCIGWGAVEVARRTTGRAMLAVLPADQAIEDAGALREVLQAAALAAQETAAIVTLGITPTRAEPGFGHLELGAEAGRWAGQPLMRVRRFTEKPPRHVAQEWVDAKTHLWNAGMFVLKVDTLRDAFRQHLPRSSAVLDELQLHPERLEELWPQLDATSIDYGIMERTPHVLTVPCDIGWSDVGTWESAAGLLPELPDVPGGRGLARTVLSLDSTDATVYAPGKAVALIGVQDLVIVDTEDALLVMARDRGQDVRQVIKALEDSGAMDLT
jgi:mannose-1-phosphate guanylyltransferase